MIGLTNRPLSSAVARLPEDERLELYSEINLLEREKSLLQLQHVPKIQEVTHVYYAAYAGHGSSFEELKRINNELLTNAIGGIEICCPGLQFVTLNTGGKVSNNIPSFSQWRKEQKPQTVINKPTPGIRHRIPHLCPFQPAPRRIRSSDPQTVRFQYLLLQPIRHPITRKRLQILELLRNPSRRNSRLRSAEQLHEHRSKPGVVLQLVSRA